MTTRVSVHFEPKLVDAAVASHPKMRELQEKLTKKYRDTAEGARAKATDLLTRVTKRFGTKYMDAMVEHIDSLFKRRDAASRVIDEVIGPAALTPDQAGTRLDGLYKGMKEDMEAITDPAKFAKKSNLKADLDIAEDVEQAFAEYKPKSKTKGAKSRTKPRVKAPRRGERLNLLRRSFKGLETGKEAVTKAAQLAPKELWQAIATETKAGQDRRIDALKAKVGSRMSDAEVADLETAVRKMSHDRAKSQRLPGTEEGQMRTAATKSLRRDLADEISGDRTLELLARENPGQVEELFQNWKENTAERIAAGKKPLSFRSYVRGEMMSVFKGKVGEWTAAFTLGKRFGGKYGEDFVILKIPKGETRESGTDLVGVYKGDRVWMIDNKAWSQALIDKVTALMGNFPDAIEEDAAVFAKNLARRGDPVIGSAVARVQKAAAEIKSITKDMDPGEIAKPEVQKRIDAVCDKYRIDRVVTNSGGNPSPVLKQVIDDAGVLLKNLSGPDIPKKRKR